MEENNSTQQTYRLEDLSRLTGLPIRTIRFYIQKGFVPQPCGKKRGSYYTDEHLETLLKIKRLSSRNTQLKDIKNLKEEEVLVADPPVGSVSMCTHISLGKGLTLVVDAQKAKMNSEQLRKLAEEICQAVDKITNSGE